MASWEENRRVISASTDNFLNLLGSALRKLKNRDFRFPDFAVFFWGYLKTSGHNQKHPVMLGIKSGQLKNTVE